MRSPALECKDCTDKQRELRNCHNRQGRRESITHKGEWKLWPESLKHVQKWGDLKFWECPRSAITNYTWEVLSLVNETVNADGDVLHLPFDGAWLQQPKWYRQAVSIVKIERAAHRNEMIKNPPKKGK